MRLKVESWIGLLVLARAGLDDGSRNPFVACWWEDASKAVSLSTSFNIDGDVIIVFAPIEKAGRPGLRRVQDWDVSSFPVPLDRFARLCPSTRQRRVVLPFAP